LVSPNNKVRLVFNASGSRATAIARFVSTYAGAGVHHVAFTARDIMFAAMEFEAHHAPRLSVPGNYYDDLSARCGLDDLALTALQHRGLMYDSDGEGEFLHIYTDAFHDRFFFEVVERRNGYSWFGAVNASVRTAAQARQNPVTVDLL
jgi:4-hydroxyphenylpyruvate dioxygenase